MAVGSRSLAGRYELTDELASGGMATVWCAQDRILTRQVAIKILHDRFARDESFLERFRREAIAAARLAHPNIVAIYDTGEEESSTGTRDHYIVMEYCAGGPLDDLARDRGPLPAARIASIGSAIAAALDHAHQHGVIHRDVKPANILVAGDGTVKVADFGIAKAAEQSGDISTTGDVLGTVAYMAPELAAGEGVDGRSDLYSLGVVLYELATGRLPFHGDSHVAVALKHVNEAPTPPRALRPSVPRELNDVIMTALAKDPAHRFHAAEDMRRALDRISGGAQFSAAAAPRRVGAEPPQPPSLGSETRWVGPVVGIVAVTILLALAIGALVDEGGPLRLPGTGGGGADTRPLEIAGAVDFDPAGDGEHPEDVPKAHDDDPGTEWTTQTYFSPLPTQKPGVGLVFDLGRSVTVTRVEIISSPGFTFELRASDNPEELSSFDVVAEDSASSETEVQIDDPATARYWLVWITDLADPGTGRASIAEVSFFGP